MSAPQSVVDELRRHHIECSSKATGEVSCGCRESGWMPFSEFVQHQADAAHKASLEWAADLAASQSATVMPIAALRRWADESDPS